MITGTVRSLHLMLSIVFVYSDSSEQVREVVMDTGFTGGLSLPLEMVSELNLPYINEHQATLADGTISSFPVFFAQIRWHDEIKGVAVFALGDRPLLGTALLDGNTVFADFIENGQVILNKREQKTT